MAFWLFQNVVVITALVAAVLVVCRLARIGPVARHALWLIVLVKFVTPPLVVWPWAAPDPLGVASLDARAGQAMVGTETLINEGDPDVEPSGAISGEHADPDGREEDDAESQDGRTSTASLWPWMAGLWLAGSLALIGIEGVRIARLRRLLRHARPAAPALVRRVATHASRLGLEPPVVSEIDGLSSPLVWGVGRPRLLWPAGLLASTSDACVDGLVVHELAHIRRRDALVGWIELVAGVIWWWNPLYWYVRSARREQAELACDAWVIDALPDGRRAYAESLLALSIGLPGPSPASALGVRAGTRRALERRLVMIMKGRSSIRLPWVGLAAMSFLSAATLPAWATAPEQASQAQAVQVPAKPTLQAPVAKLEVQAPAKAQQQTIKVTPTVVKPNINAQLDRAIKVDALVQTPRTRESRQIVVTPRESRNLTLRIGGTELPAEGQELLKGFETDRAAIEAEAAKKIEARRDALAKALQALQDKYAREGQLDEAVAIRDYIRAGMPGIDRLRLGGIPATRIIR